MTKIISIEEWAAREDVPERKAYRWAKTGKLPLRKRKIYVNGVPEDVTKQDVVKS